MFYQLSYILYGWLLFAGLSPFVSETFTLLGLGYLGVITHYVKKWSEKVERDETFILKKTVPSIILSLITTSVLVVLRNEVQNFFVVTRFSSFVVGYFGSSWFFGLVEKKIYNTNTTVTNENENRLP